MNNITLSPTPTSQGLPLAITDGTPAGLIVSAGVIGLLFAALYTYEMIQIKIRNPGEGMNSAFANGSDVDQKIAEIGSFISRGAKAFLLAEYKYMFVFVGFFSIFLFILLGAVSSGSERSSSDRWNGAGLSTIAFVVGALTSILSGYIGMQIAVFSNVRTAVSARRGYGPAFTTAFKAGAVMGFSLTSLGLLVLFALLYIFFSHYGGAWADVKYMCEALAGFGLGGSSIALFGRVGGGIYTKAADVGADLVGKVENKMNEDDPRNPAVIADNVGDNVGDIAGMGADLFGSFAEGTTAAMVITAQSLDLFNSWAALCLPLMLSAAGIFVCILTSFAATKFMTVSKKEDIEKTLKWQLIISTVLMTPTTYFLCKYALPATAFAVSTATNVTPVKVFVCTICGLWSGLAIGLTTEYYTSNTYAPVKEVAQSCETGAATNIIYGLALGYKSAVIPAFCIAATIALSLTTAAMYGIAFAALGILSTLSIGLTIDAYGPICDNAGGIAEMAGMEEEIRERTDALDAAGNTTAAIGKGFAIASAVFVSLALSGAFVTVCKALGFSDGTVNILNPGQFAGLTIGAMLPYWFSAMTMKSVGKAALDMVQEVRRQFREIPGILDGTAEPDYERCVGISTEASLREMIPPGALVILTPIIFGFFFGVEVLSGLLAGAQVSGMHMAVSCSNTGGAWDNAKKYIEGGNLGQGKGKGSDQHAAAVIGDTVGDPLKDTSGPSLNILIKLMAIISLVFAPSLGNPILPSIWNALGINFN